MKLQAKRISKKKITFIVSILVLVIWAFLGTGASLAWFTDTSPEINNIFHFADFDLKFSHRLTDGTWEEIDSKTKVFDEEALYEPGYVQVVYLKVKNEGSREFKFYTSVNVNDCSTAYNVYGGTFLLKDHLRFGVTVTSNETDMKNSVPNRETAVEIASEPLYNYDKITADLKPGEEKYIAVVVRMPEEIGNIANYRGDDIPTVELGVTAKAEQIKK